VEETINDIMETKKKQEKIKGKKMGMKNFINTYFRYKFGMKDMAVEMELKFKDSLEKCCEN
jgi:maltose-binding protein MalE